MSFTDNGKRGFRFGAVFTGSYAANKWSEVARRLEAEGFSTLLVADHYLNPMSCGPLLLAAANATTTLRIGSYVYNNDFRHPALLAKEAATIDVLSGGRLELGLGAGWAKVEYEAVGLPFDPPRVRAARFEEGVEVITRLLTGQRVSYHGEHYHISDLQGEPRPVQQPVPLLLGGGGQRMIRFAARKADIIGFVPRSLPGGGLDPADFASLDVKIAVLDKELALLGRSDGGPERSVLVFGLHPSYDAIPTDTWIPRDLVAASPYALVGGPDAVVETLLERRERLGLSYVVCFDSDIDTFIPIVRRLAS